MYLNPCTDEIQQQQQQPQSIVHHLSRVGSKMTIPFRNQGSAPRRQHKIQHSYSHDDEETLHHTKRTSESEDSIGESHDEWSATFDCYSETARQHDSAHENKEEESAFFTPLDQNEFLMECFTANECSDVAFFVLFCPEKCCLSDQLEEIVAIRTIEAGSNCQCRRVHSHKAPMFTKKLDIDIEQPTLVAIKNGSVVDKISNISSPGCWELEKWLTDTKLLTQEGESDFRCLSTGLDNL
ncbi:unnamed protein product [Cylindrotheca closterium]|uniref:Thioredoxin domain-containing protein n=1 Tax=Cylindrotheca closterium TaxID=2856 RepID=A0AAD2FM88_9STRA|nr:unnamed protein product [Cylindrotheca closterium]